MFETGGNRWRGCADGHPRRRAHAAVSGRGGHGSLFKPAGRIGPVSRPVRERPAQAGALYDRIIPREGRRWVVEDQRFAATRLVYESDPLLADLTMAGPVPVELFASTTGTDSLGREADRRVPGRREGSRSESGRTAHGRLPDAACRRPAARQVPRDFSRPSAMVPGEVTRVNFALGD